MKKIIFLLILFFVASAARAQQAQLKTPYVSGNALFLYRNSNFTADDLSTTRNGFDLEEAELAFYSDVDPYTRLDMLITIHPNYTVIGNHIEQNFVVEPEELFAESNQIPDVTLKVGKFKAFFGKHNYLHTHVYPFIEEPLVNQKLLGDEGLNDVGVSASYLMPTDWYNELSLQYLRGEGENAEFSSPTPGDGVGVAHWKNLFDLTEALTAEIGASYAQGNNSLGGTTSLSGADLTFKDRPLVGGKYHSWILAGEWIQRHLQQPGSTSEEGKGWNLWGKYQFAERWSALARYDYFEATGGDTTVNANALSNDKIKKYSAALAFQATEFSSYHLEASQENGPSNSKGDSTNNTVYLQANFTIGAHPAHSY